MKKILVSAPGKIHLLGEHVVVYGKPSLLAAINKRCYVSITVRKDTKIKIVSKNFNTFEEFTEEIILQKTKDAQKKWEDFAKTNNKVLLTSLTAKSLDYSMIAIGETLLYYQESIASGFTLEINSEVTSGMGSSSSLAVAIAAAVSLFLGKRLDKKIINEIAFRCEQKQHGFPSGGDNSVCTYGGLVWFRKETPDLRIIQPVSFSLSESLTKNFFLINTGIPKESTGAMVSIVRTLSQKRPAYTEKIFTDQEILVRNFLSTLKSGDEETVKVIIQRGEQNLEKLGVVSEHAKTIIRSIEKSGGAAKICGAGGKKKEAGILLVHHTNSNLLKSLLQSYNLSYSHLVFGTEGIKIHSNKDLPIV